jgi:putative endonuclease
MGVDAATPGGCPAAGKVAGSSRESTPAILQAEVVPMGVEQKQLGERGEDAAAAFLERVGMTVVERNWRCSAGEIDIVALDGHTVVLVEVKTRRTMRKGTPEESVTPTRQRRYSRLGAAYLQSAGVVDVPLRFDVITLSVLAEDRARLRHHRAAFVPE